MPPVAVAVRVSLARSPLRAASRTSRSGETRRSRGASRREARKRRRRDLGCFSTRELEHGRERAARREPAADPLERRLGLDVLEHERREHELDRLEIELRPLEIGDVQLEPRQPTRESRARRRDVVRVHVDADDAQRRRRVLEAVAARAAEHRDRGRRARAKLSREQLREQLRLADLRQRHVRLVVGQRDREPRIVGGHRGDIIDRH